MAVRYWLVGGEAIGPVGRLGPGRAVGRAAKASDADRAEAGEFLGEAEEHTTTANSDY